MKIEKVNDYQIKCTLTKADLEARKLKLSELAYGTDKAKSLFKDMIQQASIKYGFEAEDIPLMIEAVPIDTDSIVLIITKVENPEELDTRFTRFSPDVIGENDADFDGDSNTGKLISELFNKIKDETANLLGGDVSVTISETDDTDTEITTEELNSSKEDDSKDISKYFLFNSIYEIIKPAAVISNTYSDKSTLYCNPDDHMYILVLRMVGEDRIGFSKACNILSEYSVMHSFSRLQETSLAEHCDKLIPDHAIEKLASIG
ncbi:MAG: adaptor protein MecA [Lachnospiraceae bacterium]|nr:adaptor protein MecA [Lachnospiraceae bacterium]